MAEETDLKAADEFSFSRKKSLEAKPPVLFISGPTGSGKSALALGLADYIQIEIINADSVQVYRDFDIGSAKPSLADREKVPHHLFDIRYGDEPLNAFDFMVLARQKIFEVIERGNLPVIVGGSGLYVRSIISGIASSSDESEKLRSSRHESIPARQLQTCSSASDPNKSVKPTELTNIEPKDIERIAVALESNDEELIDELLEEFDSLTASRVHLNDRYRRKRALRAFLEQGMSMRELHIAHQKTKELEFSPLILVLEPKRDELYQRIDSRVDKMLELGLLEEVRALLVKFADCRVMKTIGYKELAEYLRRDIALEEATRLIKRNSRRLAKRQTTWWRNQPSKLGWTPIGVTKIRLFDKKGEFGIADIGSGDYVLLPEDHDSLVQSISQIVRSIGELVGLGPEEGTLDHRLTEGEQDKAQLDYFSGELNRASEVFYLRLRNF